MFSNVRRVILPDGTQITARFAGAIHQVTIDVRGSALLKKVARLLRIYVRPSWGAEYDWQISEVTDSESDACAVKVTNVEPALFSCKNWYSEERVYSIIGTNNKDRYTRVSEEYFGRSVVRNGVTIYTHTVDGEDVVGVCEHKGFVAIVLHEYDGLQRRYKVNELVERVLVERYRTPLVDIPTQTLIPFNASGSEGAAVLTHWQLIKFHLSVALEEDENGVEKKVLAASHSIVSCPGTAELATISPSVQQGSSSSTCAGSCPYPGQSTSCSKETSSSTSGYGVQNEVRGKGGIACDYLFGTDTLTILTAETGTRGTYNEGSGSEILTESVQFGWIDVLGTPVWAAVGGNRTSSGEYADVSAENAGFADLKIDGGAVYRFNGPSVLGYSSVTTYSATMVNGAHDYVSDSFDFDYASSNGAGLTISSIDLRKQRLLVKENMSGTRTRRVGVSGTETMTFSTESFSRYKLVRAGHSVLQVGSDFDVSSTFVGSGTSPYPWSPDLGAIGAIDGCSSPSEEDSTSYSEPTSSMLYNQPYDVGRANAALFAVKDHDDYIFVHTDSNQVFRVCNETLVEITDKFDLSENDQPGLLTDHFGVVIKEYL